MTRGGATPRRTPGRWRVCACLALGLWLLASGAAGSGQAPAPPGQLTLRREAVWRIEPTEITCQPGETVQFHSFLPANYAGLVAWSATGGAITQDGFYTAPGAEGDHFVYARLTPSLTARARVLVRGQQGETTISADRFVDSIGVNIHLHYDDTVYRRDFDLTRRRLVELGVRHVRDGLVDTTWLPYYERHDELGRRGIKGIFIASIDAPESLLRDYPRRVPEAFEAYEAPNEYDTAGDPRWVERLRASVQTLRNLKAIPALARYPVYGPSLTTESARTAFGDVSGSIDIGNMHNYFAGHHPGTEGWSDGGYGSIAWNVSQARATSGSKPLVSTETGYPTDLTVADTVPPVVAGKYMPRLLLEQFRLGITRTYIYELADEAAQPGSYGLLFADGSPKPAFHAVSELIALLSDPGPSHATKPLRYTLTGATEAVRSMAFQKRNGRFFLFLWLERPAFDPQSRRDLDVPAQSVSVSVQSARLVQVHRWDVDGRRSAAPAQGQQTTVSVTDIVQALELVP